MDNAIFLFVAPLGGPARPAWLEFGIDLIADADLLMAFRKQATEMEPHAEALALERM